MGWDSSKGKKRNRERNEESKGARERSLRERDGDFGDWCC